MDQHPCSEGRRGRPSPFITFTATPLKQAMHTYTITLALLLVAGTTLAQTKTQPQVVRSAPKEMKEDVNVLPAAFAEASGLVLTSEVDTPPVHPDCADLKDPQGCTAQAVLAVLRNHAGKPGLDLKHAGEQPVTVSFLVNKFGEVKDVRVEHPGDPQLSQKAVVAMYDLPKFNAATKGGGRVDAGMRMVVPYGELFKQ
jgi:hypothetical protein